MSQSLDITILYGIVSVVLIGLLYPLMFSGRTNLIGLTSVYRPMSLMFLLMHCVFTIIAPMTTTLLYPMVGVSILGALVMMIFEIRSQSRPANKKTLYYLLGLILLLGLLAELNHGLEGMREGPPREVVLVVLCMLGFLFWEIVVLWRRVRSPHLMLVMVLVGIGVAIVLSRLVLGMTEDGRVMTGTRPETFVSSGQYARIAFPSLIALVSLILNNYYMEGLWRREQLRRARSQHSRMSTERIAGVGSWEMKNLGGEIRGTTRFYDLLGTPYFSVPGLEGSLDLNQFLECLVDEDKDRFVFALMTCIRTQEPQKMDLTALLPGGQLRYFEQLLEVYSETEDPDDTVIQGTLLDITSRKMAELRLEELNRNLEERVIERTRELQLEIEERRQAEKRLAQAQSSLIQSEKMAALGGLVAGVAHEINTPVGVTVTAASLLKDLVRNVGIQFREGALKRSVLEVHFTETEKVVSVIEVNLQRAAALIKDFKEIAVDQSGEEYREISLAHYVGQIVNSLQPSFKMRPVTVDMAGIDTEIRLNTLPGAFSQIVTNLVMNSLNHAFDEEQSGVITIIARRSGNELTFIYKDNGKGMPEEIRERVFEPFVTTRRGRGGSGLGMHVVYNIVTSRLGGKIVCRSQPNQGVEFEMTVPC